MASFCSMGLSLVFRKIKIVALILAYFFIKNSKTFEPNLKTMFNSTCWAVLTTWIGSQTGSHIESRLFWVKTQLKIDFKVLTQVRTRLREPELENRLLLYIWKLPYLGTGWVWKYKLITWPILTNPKKHIILKNQSGSHNIIREPKLVNSHEKVRTAQHQYTLYMSQGWNFF